MKKLIVYLITPVFFISLISLPSVLFATSENQILIDSKEEFEEGSIDSNLDSLISPGDLELKYKKVIHTDTTTNDFTLGDTITEILSSQIINNEVNLGKSYVYDEYHSPILGDDSVYHIFLDETNHLLYISTYGGGLSVINTQDTADPTDDTLIITYTPSTNPAIADIRVNHTILDETNHLLYVSTERGLSVINTQGTIETDDDTLVKTYNATSVPSIGTYNYVESTFLDETNHLVYISTYGNGLAVINTQNTITPTDDTLLKRYTTSTTPAIGSNKVYHSFLDQINHLLYVSTEGGLSVINTQNTITPTDDTLVKKYTTSTTPALGSNYLYHSFLDETNHLVYVSTEGGLSVINTQNTITPTDDTLVKKYTTSTTPAILDNIVFHSFLDEENNLLYVSTRGGLSVIDTQNTITPVDDTLVKTYTTSTVPGLQSNYVFSPFIDKTNNLIYINTGKGISVINLDEIYNNQGTYINRIFAESDTTIWQNKANLPEVRISGSGEIINNKMYIVGGADDSYGTPLNTMISYNPVSDTYESLASMTTGRVSPVSGVIDGKLYIAGGRGPASGLSSLEIYDPETNTWSLGASMHEARIGATGGVYEGKLYIVGGMNSGCSVLSETSLEVYDPVLNTWEYKTPAPIEKITGSTAQFINGKMYLAGGQTDCSGGDSNIIISYDVSTDTWDTNLHHMPTERSGGSSIVFNDKFVYIGGTGYNWDSVSDIYSYDPVINSWSIFSRLPIGIHRPFVFNFNNDLYVMGGRNIDWNPINSNYFLGNEFISDIYQKEKYTDIEWNATTPDGTEIELLYSLDGGNTYVSLGNEEGQHRLSNDPAYDILYKAILRTNDTGVTPSLEDVTISYVEANNGYYEGNEGVYLSKIFNPSVKRVSFDSLSINQQIPEGTSITYYTRTGDTGIPDDSWSAWEEAEENINSPRGKYIQLKAILSTTNTNTPTISSIGINYSSIPIYGSYVDKTPIVFDPIIDLPSINIETKQPELGQKELINNENITSPFTLTRTLKYRSWGKDVLDLQHYLNTHGFIVSQTGPGSLGKETTYFGPKTKASVILFQKTNNLIGDGIVGPLTKAKIEQK